MKLNKGDKVVLIKSDDFYLKGLQQESGTIVNIAAKTIAPYQVEFNNNVKRWCKEEELEIKCA